MSTITLLFTFGVGVVIGCAITILGSFMVMGSKASEMERKQKLWWQEIEAERKRLNAVERREVKT